MGPVIEPDFYWDFGPRTPSGPGTRAAIFSNCERLELFLDGQHSATLHPDRSGFPNLLFPPFFANLEVDSGQRPELRIDGFLGERRVITRSFSADRTADRLWLRADDAELRADGADATRLAFGVQDKFGASRPFVEGQVALRLRGPGSIIGDNPFDLAPSGGAGAVWVRSHAGAPGKIAVAAQHAELGESWVQIHAR